MSNIFPSIIAGFKDRTRADIQKWRRALELAQSPINPRMWLLQDLYDNLESDGHYLAQKELRKTATSGYGFSIIDVKTGEVNQEKTNFFCGEWFFDFLDYALDSIFKGFTLIELTDPKTLAFNLIPRRNVIGTLGIVQRDISDCKGIDFNSKDFQNTLVKIGKPSDLGLMANICGQLIWKRNAQQSWAEFTERFGMPLITATTNQTTSADIRQLDDMLAELGESARAVLPEGTTINVTPFAGSDAFKVYDSQIDRINAEISKPITGGTMVTDDGSSRSQSEVHERNLDDKLSEADRRMIMFVVNGQLIPLLQRFKYPFNPDTDRFQFNQSFELDLTQHWNIVNQMIAQGYEVDEKWLAQTFNVPITGRREPVGVQPSLAADMPLYQNFR
jgi:phage gp29-like protein